MISVRPSLACAAIVASLALAGCGDETTPKRPGEIPGESVGATRLPDGKTIAAPSASTIRNLATAAYCQTRCTPAQAKQATERLSTILLLAPQQIAEADRLELELDPSVQSPIRVKDPEIQKLLDRNLAAGLALRTYERAEAMKAAKPDPKQVADARKLYEQQYRAAETRVAAEIVVTKSLLSELQDAVSSNIAANVLDAAAIVDPDRKRIQRRTVEYTRADASRSAIAKALFEGRADDETTPSDIIGPIKRGDRYILAQITKTIPKGDGFNEKNAADASRREAAEKLAEEMLEKRMRKYLSASRCTEETGAPECT